MTDMFIAKGYGGRKDLSSIERAAVVIDAAICKPDMFELDSLH